MTHVRLQFWNMLLFLFCIVVVPSRGDELDQEISQLKKELSRVQGQRKDENSLAAREKTEFAAYQKRTSDKLGRLTQQTDSLQVQIDLMTRKSDSLNIGLASLQRNMRELELVRERLRKALLTAADSAAAAMERMPPLIREQYRPALQYLSSEITAGSVETTEALFRLMRILQDARAVCREIQVVEGASPVSQLRGTVYRLRIGALFEAVVDAQGTRAFIWDSTPQDSSRGWIPLDDKELAVSLRKAVLIREGKSIPELVKIPFDGQRKGDSHE